MPSTISLHTTTASSQETTFTTDKLVKMPTYRSLTLSLISQFDMLTIPEYAPPSTPPDPFTDSSNIPALVDPSKALVSVFIPIYPSSQFWISYNILPLHAPGLLYYFKLLINGKCIVSWGCGEEDGYKGVQSFWGNFAYFQADLLIGKTMFSLYGRPGKREIERRILAFGPPSDGERAPELHEDFMEVRVYRSKGRRRVLPEVKEFKRVGMQYSGVGSRKMAANYCADGVE